MSARLETFLARIYVDADTRSRFLKSPREEAIAAGLSPAEVDAMEKIDRNGLQMTANSLMHRRQKRQSKSAPR
jgi:hypothetical protein